jgi:GntR family transcriptional regulator/MocR family aminotransferase
VQAVLADFIREGHFARHLRRMRALYGERRGALAGALAEELGGALRVLGCGAGMHLVATLPDGLRDRDLSVRAAGRGLWAMPLSSCYLKEPARQGFVLGFGGTETAEIRDGVRRFRSVLEGRRSVAFFEPGTS